MRSPKNIRVSARVQESAERLLMDWHYKKEDTYSGDIICNQCESYWPCDTAIVALAVLERDP